MRVLFLFLISFLFWSIFAAAFIRDRSRYRNCYFLFFALAFTIPFILAVSGEHEVVVGLTLLWMTLIALLIVPFFLIHNGIVMIRREGRSKAHLLSLFLGIAVLVGEAAFAFMLFGSGADGQGIPEGEIDLSALWMAAVLISATVIYGSMAFVIFMIYTLFLMIIPVQRDFDYVIIHGAGLLQGDKLSKLLQERLDKAILVYRKDPTPPKMIPSGGKGSDESISEAEAMKRYLLSQGIPEYDILTEDQSTTTLENLQRSKEILDRQEGRKYTALVTSNYHVYRALRYCRKVGLDCTGIGSHVAFYYWPSALIREFIAIHAEKKHALLFIAGWLLLMAALLYGLL